MKLQMGEGRVIWMSCCSFYIKNLPKASFTDAVDRLGTIPLSLLCKILQPGSGQNPWTPNLHMLQSSSTLQLFRSNFRGKRRNMRQPRAVLKVEIQCCRWVQPLWQLVQRFLKKLKTALPYDPTTTLLGIYQKASKSAYLHIHVYWCTTIPINQDMKLTIVSTKRTMRKYVTHIHTHHIININVWLERKWMELWSIVLSKINQIQKDKYHSCRI